MSDLEWHEWRSRGIGGSDIAGILGLSPWASPYSVWARKVELVKDGAEQESERMEFGKRAELMLTPWFEDLTGLKVTGEQRRAENPTAPWMRCTLDGDIKSNNAIVEYKTTSNPAAEWEREIPVYYQCQATWNMLVTDTTKCYFGVLHLAFANPQFRVYEFNLDPDEAEFVLRKVSAFWQGNVLAGDPPEMDAHDATTQALNGIWQDVVGTIEADDHVVGLLKARSVAKDAVDSFQAGVDEIDNELRLILGDAEVVEHDGRKVASWKWEERRGIDLEALRNDLPDIAATYEKVSRSRVLRITKPKG